MKLTNLFLLFLCMAFISCHSSRTTQSSNPANMQTTGKMLRHIVLFKFKDGTPPEKVKEVEQAFAALQSKINTIVGYEWGYNISPENLAQGYTHCFLVTFKDAAGRDYYLPHPDHKTFGQLIGPHLDKVLVFDFIDQN